MPQRNRAVELLRKRCPARSAAENTSCENAAARPDKQEKAFQTVLEQAEVLSEAWALG